MRFHVIGLPHTQVNYEFSACAFTEKVRKFCIMMTNLGHEVFLYAGDQSIAPTKATFVCITEEERLEHCAGKHFTDADWTPSLPGWKLFNSRAINALEATLQPTDFICLIGGLSQKAIADAYPNNMTVEFGIGHPGSFARYRVWESYAWMHTSYGAESHGASGDVNGKWFDAVIPGYFEVEKFPFKKKKKNYCFFIGRLVNRKGYQIAVDVCKDLGMKLIVAGQGEPPREDHVEYVGVIGPEQRGKLMSEATAVFVPTIYIEPFGNVAVEAQGCGTPVITTDWGAFTETVKHGVTGFRCRTFGEFKRAVAKCKKLDPKVIRKHAVDNYSLEVIGLQYQEYFERLSHLWKDGWYEGMTSPLEIDDNGLVRIKEGK